MNELVEEEKKFIAWCADKQVLVVKASEKMLKMPVKKKKTKIERKKIIFKDLK